MAKCSPPPHTKRSILPQNDSGYPTKGLFTLMFELLHSLLTYKGKNSRKNHFKGLHTQIKNEKFWIVQIDVTQRS